MPFASRLRLAGRRWRWIVAGLVVVALVVVGGAWWRMSGESEQPTLKKRLAAVSGVSSVDSGEHGNQHTVYIESDTGRDRLSRSLRRISEIPQKSHAERADVEVRIGEVSLEIDEDLQPDRSAAVIVSLVSIDELESTEMSSDAEGQVSVWLGEPADVLPVARRVVAGFVRNRVADFGVNQDARLRVYSNDDERQLTVWTEEPTDTKRQLRKVQRTLRRVDGRLLSGGIGEGVEVSVTVDHRSQMRRASHLFRAAFDDGDLGLTMRADHLEVSGNASPTQALAVVKQLEDAGAEVTDISARCDSVTLSVEKNKLDQVMSLLGAKGGLDTDASIRLTMGVHDRTVIEATPRELGWLRRLAVALQRDGYNVQFQGEDSYRGEGAALAVRSQLSADGERLRDLTRAAPRAKLIETLRTGDWNGHLFLQILGLRSGDSDDDPWGLRFRSTVSGKSHDVLFPGQLRAGDPKDGTALGAAKKFLAKWDATAS